MNAVPPVRMAAIGLNHNHIYGMAGMLQAAGAELVAAHAPEPDLRAAFQARFPAAQAVAEADAIYEDASIDLVLTAAIPDQRAGIAIRAMQHGKDVLSDKAGMTSLEQWRQVKATQAATRRIYAIAYSERFASRATVRALELVRTGAIGQVIHTIGLGPHSLRRATRPDWFFRKAAYGGILCDLATHQFDQYLAFSLETDPTIVAAQVANRAHPDDPELEDFGDAVVRGERCAGYIRVDWFSPAGLATWGDTRLTVLGTHGYIEVRKNIDVGRQPATGDHLFIVDDRSARHEHCTEVELPFARQFLHDIRHRSQTAMSQEHCFLAMRLALEAQAQAAVLP